MIPAVSSDGLREALLAWAEKWLKRHRPVCNWCGFTLTGVSEYIEWVLTLREAWPSTLKRQPADKVFCDECARDAIVELHGGPKYVVGEDLSIPF